MTCDDFRAPTGLARALGISRQALLDYSEREIDNARLGLTDLEGSAALSRRLFFAGVFAAILGALAIELLNGTFDVAEHWSARHRTGRDEQEQRPEPNPKPPDPDPDDDVGRDQLPLF
jgi:hypothetical protein